MFDQMAQKITKKSQNYFPYYWLTLISSTKCFRLTRLEKSSKAKEIVAPLLLGNEKPREKFRGNTESDFNTC